MKIIRYIFLLFLLCLTSIAYSAPRTTLLPIAFGPASLPLVCTGFSAAWSPVLVDSTATCCGNTDSSISVVDSNTIWIGYMNSNNKIVAAKSIDGGTSWTLITNITSDVSRNPSLSAVSANVAYIAYGNSIVARTEVAVTIDGGSNWTTTDIDTTLNGTHSSIHAVDASTAFFSTARQSNIPRIYRTTDGGSNWALATGGTHDNLEFKSSRWLYAPDANNVYIGYYGNTAGPAGTRGFYVAISNDGGVTFTSQAVDLRSDINRRGMWASIHSSGNTVVAAYMDENDTTARFSISTDGGSNWSSQQLFASGTFNYSSSIRTIDSDSFIIAFAITSNPGIRTSDDGGATWTSTFTIETTASSDISIDIIPSTNSEVFVSYHHTSTGALYFAKNTCL